MLTYVTEPEKTRTMPILAVYPCFRQNSGHGLRDPSEGSKQSVQKPEERSGQTMASVTCHTGNAEVAGIVETRKTVDPRPPMGISGESMVRTWDLARVRVPGKG